MSDDAHLDHDALAELKDVMEEDFDILLETYLSDSRTRLEALKEAADGEDSEAFAKTAHSFKGSCINIGALRLGELCYEAEQSGKAGDMSQAQRMLSEIVTEFDLVESQLRSYLSA